MVDLGSSSGPGGFSLAFGVSGDGSVIVGEEGPSISPTHAFIWTAAGGFPDLGAGTASAITPDASTVVGQANYATAFLWTNAGGMQNLGSLPGFSNSVAGEGDRRRQDAAPHDQYVGQAARRAAPPDEQV
jgi:probable HAF family extracellular repeat protein